MNDKVIRSLREAERALVKFRNKIKRADLEYTVQASISSIDPTVVKYAAQMTPVALGLAPITFIDDSVEELVSRIKIATKNINYDTIEIAWHEAQIKSCEKTIEGHKARVEDIKNPKPDIDEDAE